MSNPTVPHEIPLQVRIQATPNPDALKFVMNRDVKSEGKATFTKDDLHVELPLVRDLLMIPKVTQVHLFENVVTITKAEGEWLDIEPEIRSILLTRMPIHNARFSSNVSEMDRRKNLSPELQKVEEILDQEIRPGLQGDGGDLEVLRLEGKVLYVRYQGACGSCPSSTTGTLMAIEDILRREFDADLSVVTE